MKHQVLTTFLLPSSFSDDSSSPFPSLFFYLFIKEIDRYIFLININIKGNISLIRLLIWLRIQRQGMKQDLQILEQVAKESIFATDFQVKKIAENKWKQYLFSANEEQILYLLKEGSQTILFGIALVFLKNYQGLKLRNGILTLINQEMIMWYQFNGSFARNGVQLQLHISKTFGDYIACTLKQFLIDDATQLDVLKFLQILAQKPKYLLFVLLKFIQIISIIDNTMGFVKYKGLVQKFQQKIIPMIIQKLVPFFISINDTIEEKELASMQGKLSFNDESPIDEKDYILQFTHNNRFTEMVFVLLNETLDFKYNIHYTEYEENFNYTNFIIPYPDVVLRKIINEEFLTSLYKTITHLMKLPHFHLYLEVCLKSLKKILLAKLNHLRDAERFKVLEVNFNGLNFLLELLYQKKVAERKSGLQIIDCNLKLISIIDFDKFVKTSLNKPTFKLNFQRWLHLTSQVPLMILSNDKNDITPSNELLTKSISLMYQISNLMQISKINQYREALAQSYHDYTTSFLHSIIFLKPNLQTHKESSNKTTTDVMQNINENIKLLFLQSRLLLTYDYKQSFSQLLSIFAILKDNITAEGVEYSWGNLILFAKYLVLDSVIYECNIFGDSLVKIYHKRNVQYDKPHEIELLSTFIFKVIGFIIDYSRSPMKSKYINNAIAIFLEAYLLRCAQKCDSKNKSEQYKDQYFQIFDFLHKHIMKNIQPVKDDQFILTLLKIYLNFLFIENIDNVDYILSSTYRIITQFKRQTRDVFFNTKIYAELFKYFQSLCQMQIPHHLIKCNAQIYQIITILLLDNSLDTYKKNMSTILGIISTSVEKRIIVKALYDIIGILQSLQDRNIFNRFIKMLRKNIELTQLMDLLAQMVNSQPQRINDALHLGYLLIHNKANRLEQPSSLFDTYNIIQILLPLWNYCLKMMTTSRDMDFQQSYAQICNILGCFFNQNYINIYVLQLHMKTQLYTFLKLIYTNFTLCMENIFDCPVITLKIMRTTAGLLDVTPKLIFNSKDTQLTQRMEEFVLKMMMTIIDNGQAIMADIFNKDILEGMLSAIVRYYQFIYKYSSHKHLPNVLRNIASVVRSSLHVKKQFFFAIVKIGLILRAKSMEVLNCIAKLFLRLIMIYNYSMNEIMDPLELKDERDMAQMKLIISDTKNPQEQYCWLIGRVKDWLKKQNRFFSYANIDY